MKPLTAGLVSAPSPNARNFAVAVSSHERRSNPAGWKARKNPATPIVVLPRIFPNDLSARGPVREAHLTKLSSIPPRIESSIRSEEHTSELQSRGHLVCRLLLEKKNTDTTD